MALLVPDRENVMRFQPIFELNVERWSYGKDSNAMTAMARRLREVEVCQDVRFQRYWHVYFRLGLNSYWWYVERSYDWSRGFVRWEAGLHRPFRPDQKK